LFNSSCFRVGTKSVLFLATIVSAVLGLDAGAFGQTTPQLLPYTVTALGGGATANPGAGATCPRSGLKSTDAFGDGCLATEVVLNGPRFAVSDSLGNIFFSDTGNALVRRIDVTTGVISIVVGGATSNPAAGATCGAYTSTDANGDGCLGTAVKIGAPHGLAFSPSGDLYFADYSFGEVRKIAATNGVIQTTGVISNVAGNITTFGYLVNVYTNNVVTTPVIAATGSYLNDPSGIAFDQKGNLYIADEGNNAIEVVNLGTAAITVTGIPVPAGTIAKIAGYGSLNTKTPAGECPNFTAAATGSRGGCYFGTFTNGNPAKTSNLDSDYDVAVDAAGNIYFANEFTTDVGQITPAGIVNVYAALVSKTATASTAKRGLATTIAMGSDFSIALDPLANMYVSDTSSGIIWRVDAANQGAYVVAGGLPVPTVCSTATDTYGDGCPATQATFGTYSGAFAKANAPFLAGVRVDPFGSLIVTDLQTDLVRRISSGIQFGSVVGSKTQILDIHFGVGDSPAANAYTLTAGSAIFSLGSATCTSNSDTTEDCILPVTAAPAGAGPIAGTLSVVSTAGQTSTFALSGIASSGISLKVTTVSSTNGCTSTTIATGSPVTLSATVSELGGTATGTVTFFNGTAQIGSPVPLNSSAQASLTTSFSAVGTNSITAVYSGDSNFKPLTSAANVFATATPSFAAALNSAQSNTVAAGQYALYAFTLTTNVYSGNVTFACSGLPANSSCVFTPATVTENGCSANQVIALSIVTTQGTPVKQSSFAAAPFGRGPWTALGTLPGLALALLITLRRRKSTSFKYGQIWLAIALLIAVSGATACGNGTQSTPGTPSGTSTVTVTAAGSGTTVPLNITLTVK
jgi:sugar lactone lactonase YvrE